jgi:UTP--glucose-1-phosphate uridylyltransferase
MKPIRTVVFPVGGLGTRFLPATKSMPKEMLPVVSKPLIHYAFEEAMAAGIERFIFITGRNKNSIANHFDHAYELEATLDAKKKEKHLRETRDWLPEPGNIIFIRQQKPLGLGHAIWCARHAVGDEPFAVSLADDLVKADTPCLMQLINAAEQKPNSNIVGVMDVPREDTKSYGILDIESEEDKLVKARGLVEKPAPEDAPSTLSIIGRYVLQPSIFSVLENQGKGAGGEIQITDAMSSMIPDTPMYGYRYDGTRFDCGVHSGFVEANLAYALEHPEIGPQVKDVIKAYANTL